jgi:hypothetical protein
MIPKNQKCGLANSLLLKTQQNFFSSKKPKPSAETLKAWDKVKEEVQKSRKLSVRGWQS